MFFLRGDMSLKMSCAGIEETWLGWVVKIHVGKNIRMASALEFLQRYFPAWNGSKFNIHSITLRVPSLVKEVLSFRSLVRLHRRQSYP
ncbi:hypothetical protein EYC84_009085 [Monilinia fructicola]|uniref:Uncharacterized protein n=1 Tax=Monilinia fructicola TaxID=38448 RepID=A0A5M9JD48_MONFR|nr:hypothetical protein EYC84_009085 [Monilinia fructicola]